MAEKIRWGILGTGAIARKFAEGLKVLDDAELVAVGSRTQESADAFGDAFRVPRRHASYEALASDAHVDVIYVATPHALHKDNTILCLQAGKPVLCEKPFAIHAREAEEMIRCARERRLFLMEAMWSRFFPIMFKVRELLRGGVIGEPRILAADFGFRAEINSEGRLFNPALGGGALLDVGVYPVSLSSMIFGTPARITGMAHLGETGVDEQSAVILGFAGGALAVLYAAIRTRTPQEAVIMGTEGQIRIHSAWWRPVRMTVSGLGKEDGVSPEVVELPYEGNGYNYEATEVMQCLHAGRQESDLMPLDETLAIMRTLDEIRAQWGLTYPMEAACASKLE